MKMGLTIVDKINLKIHSYAEYIGSGGVLMHLRRKPFRSRDIMLF